MKTLFRSVATFLTVLASVGTSQAQSTNVLRLPGTQMNNSYQLDFSPGESWCWADNFTNGLYDANWYAVNWSGATISYRLDRLYDLSTFKYGDNTDLRVNTFEITAGTGAAQAYTDTSTFSGGVVTPTSGTIGRRGGYVRWHATSFTDGGHGGTEFEVWGTPTLYKRIANPSIYTNYQEYSSSYAVSNVLDDALWQSYASSGGGTDTYITFDFSVPTRVSAVEIWDRGGGPGSRAPSSSSATT